MKPTAPSLLENFLLFAVILGPFVAVTIWSWRSVVIGALGLAAFALFFYTLLGVAGMGANPSAGNPLVILVAGWGLAAALLFVGFWLARQGKPIRPDAILIGATALAWALWMKGQLPDRLWPQSAASIAKENARKENPDLVFRDKSGADTYFPGHLSYVDAVYLAPGKDSSDRLIRMLRDRDLTRLHGRPLLIVVPDFSVPVDSIKAIIVTQSATNPVPVDVVPGFYDPRTGTFSLNPLEWLISRVRVPPDSARAIYARHFENPPPDSR